MSPDDAIGPEYPEGAPAFVRWIAAITRLSGFLVGLAAFAIAVLVTWEVIGRTFFATTTGWVNDVSEYMMAFVAFGGAGYALAEGAHVGVDLLITRVSPAVRRVLAWIADVAMLAIVALLCWLSAQFWWEAFETGERSWGLFTIDLWIPYSFFMLGMFWLLVVHLVKMVHRRRARAA